MRSSYDGGQFFNRVFNDSRSPIPERRWDEPAFERRPLESGYLGGSSLFDREPVPAAQSNVDSWRNEPQSWNGPRVADESWASRAVINPPQAHRSVAPPFYKASPVPRFRGSSPPGRGRKTRTPPPRPRSTGNKRVGGSKSKSKTPPRKTSVEKRNADTGSSKKADEPKTRSDDMTSVKKMADDELEKAAKKQLEMLSNAQGGDSAPPPAAEATTKQQSDGAVSTESSESKETKSVKKSGIILDLNRDDIHFYHMKGKPGPKKPFLPHAVAPAPRRGESWADQYRSHVSTLKSTVFNGPAPSGPPSRRPIGPPAYAGSRPTPGPYAPRGPDPYVDYYDRERSPHRAFPAPRAGPDYGPRGGEYPPRDSEYFPRGHDYPARHPDYPPRGPDYPPRGPEYPPRGSEYPPRGPEYPPRGSDYLPHGREYPPRGSEYPPRGSEYPPRGPDYPSRGPEYPPRGSDYPPRGQDYPPRAVEYSPRGSDYPPRGSEYPPRAAPHGIDRSQYPPKYPSAYPGKDPGYPPERPEPIHYDEYGRPMPAHDERRGHDEKMLADRKPPTSSSQTSAAKMNYEAYVKQQTVSSVVDPSKFIEDLTDLGDEWTELADLVREPVTSSGKSAPPTSSSEGGSSTGGPRTLLSAPKVAAPMDTGRSGLLSRPSGGAPMPPMNDQVSFFRKDLPSVQPKIAFDRPRNGGQGMEYDNAAGSTREPLMKSNGILPDSSGYRMPADDYGRRQPEFY